MTMPMTPPPISTIQWASIKVVAPEGLNTSLFLVINRLATRTPWAHGFMHAYALWLGVALLCLVFLVAYVIIWWRRDVRAAALMLLAGVATFVALGLNQLIGHAVKELRPYDTLRHVLVLVPRANDYAFPSDHAVVAGGLIAATWLVTRRAAVSPSAAAPTARHFDMSMVALAATNTVVGALLCFARVYVGAHYPSDVVAGLVVGAVVVIALSLLRPIAYRIATLLEPTFAGALFRRPWAPGASLE